MGNFVSLGALSAALAVALGAFGAHGLKKIASAEQLGWWETAARYQLMVALAVVLFGLFRMQRPGAPTSGMLLLAGTLIFCGTLYAMALGAPRWFGAITPLGGLCLIAGLLAFAWAAR